MCVCVCVCHCASSVHPVLVYVRAHAEQYAAAQHEDGGAPAQAVAPVELVVRLQDVPVDELDGVEDQGAGLEDRCRPTHKPTTLTLVWERREPLHAATGQKEARFDSLVSGPLCGRHASGSTPFWAPYANPLPV